MCDPAEALFSWIVSFPSVSTLGMKKLSDAYDCKAISFIWKQITNQTLELGDDLNENVQKTYASLSRMYETKQIRVDVDLEKIVSDKDENELVKMLSPLVIIAITSSHKAAVVERLKMLPPAHASYIKSIIKKHIAKANNKEDVYAKIEAAEAELKNLRSKRANSKLLDSAQQMLDECLQRNIEIQAQIDSCKARCEQKQKEEADLQSFLAQRKKYSSSVAEMKGLQQQLAQLESNRQLVLKFEGMKKVAIETNQIFENSLVELSQKISQLSEDIQYSERIPSQYDVRGCIELSDFQGTIRELVNKIESMSDQVADFSEDDNNEEAAMLYVQVRELQKKKKELLQKSNEAERIREDVKRVQSDIICQREQVQAEIDRIVDRTNEKNTEITKLLVVAAAAKVSKEKSSILDSMRERYL